MSVEKTFESVANFLYEVGILSKTPRSGFHFLGSGQQSVAEHIHRAVYVGYALAQLSGADASKVMKMCLLHDLPEARVSDLNYVHQKYTDRHEDRALGDLAATLPFGDDIMQTIEEYEARKSKEAVLAKDADNLEWIISLKEQVDIGNSRAKEWIDIAYKRLKTEVARKLSDKIMSVDSNNWWFSQKDDPWWVDRKSSN